MVDSHVLVGSCAQVGRDVHLAAAVQVGGVLEPPGARPVVVEDDAFVGGGAASTRASSSGAARSSGPASSSPARAASSTSSRSASCAARRRRPWWCRRAPSSCPAPGRPHRTGRANVASPCPCRSSSSTATRAPRRVSRSRTRYGERAPVLRRPPVGEPRIEVGATVAGLAPTSPAGAITAARSTCTTWRSSAARAARLRAALPAGGRGRLRHQGQSLAGGAAGRCARPVSAPTWLPAGELSGRPAGRLRIPGTSSSPDPARPMRSSRRRSQWASAR